MRKNTMCVQGGYSPKNGEPRVTPICQSTTYKYDSSETVGKLFDLEEEGFFYTRIGNPTVDVVEKKIAMLEGGVAERAAQKASEEDIKKLTEILDLTEFYIERQNMQQLQAMDGQFHQLIYEMSGSRMFKRVLKDLHYYIGLTRAASLKCEGRAAQSVKEHRAVLEAIAQHDGKKANKLMHLHVNKALENVLKRHLQEVQG